MKRFATVLSVVALAACGRDASVSAPPVGPLGEWHLRRVGGNGLPTATGGGVIVSSDLSIGADGSYSLHERYQSPSTMIDDNGSWTLNGKTIYAFGSLRGNSFLLQWGGDSLVNVAPSGSAFVYTR